MTNPNTAPSADSDGDECQHCFRVSLYDRKHDDYCQHCGRAEAVAPEAKPTDTQRLDWLDQHCSFVADEPFRIGPYKVGQLRQMADDGIAQSSAAAAPPAPPAPLPGKESRDLLQQAYDALDSMGGFGFTQKASKAMHELHAAITSAKEQTK